MGPLPPQRPRLYYWVLRPCLVLRGGGGGAHSALRKQRGPGHIPHLGGSLVVRGRARNPGNAESVCRVLASATQHTPRHHAAPHTTAAEVHSAYFQPLTLLRGPFRRAGLCHILQQTRQWCSTPLTRPTSRTHPKWACPSHLPKALKGRGGGGGGDMHAREI